MIFSWDEKDFYSSNFVSGEIIKISTYKNGREEVISNNPEEGPMSPVACIEPWKRSSLRGNCSCIGDNTGSEVHTMYV